MKANPDFYIKAYTWQQLYDSMLAKMKKIEFIQAYTRKEYFPSSKMIVYIIHVPMQGVGRI